MRWLIQKAVPALKLLAAIAVLPSVFCTGVYAGQAVLEQHTTRNTDININTDISPRVECRVVETDTAQHFEKLPSTTTYVERIKRVPLELHNFSDLVELKQWLAELDANTNVVYLQSPGDTIDCDDYATALQQDALADGYLVNLEIIESSTYNTAFNGIKLPTGKLHAINLVIIGNDAYYIEPQTGEVALAAHLD